MKRFTFFLLAFALTFNVVFAQTSYPKAEMQDRIDSLITTNGTKKITGAILNNVLKDMVESVNTIVQQNQPKYYKALISQSGTDAPTVAILENTLGYIPTLSRSATGTYKINIAVDWNKAIYFLGNNVVNSPNNNTIITNIQSAFQIETYNSSFTKIDNILYRCPVLIAVYE